MRSGDRRDSSVRPAQTDGSEPTLIVVDTHIGYGAPGKQDTAAAHGEPRQPRTEADRRGR